MKLNKVNWETLRLDRPVPCKELSGRKVALQTWQLTTKWVIRPSVERDNWERDNCRLDCTSRTAKPASPGKWFSCLAPVRPQLECCAQFWLPSTRRTLTSLSKSSRRPPRWSGVSSPQYMRRGTYTVQRREGKGWGPTPALSYPLSSYRHGRTRCTTCNKGHCDGTLKKIISFLTIRATIWWERCPAKLQISIHPWRQSQLDRTEPRVTWQL